MAATITINEPYTARSGNVSITVESEPVVHTFDERALGEGPAKAISDAIAAGIRAITETAAASTVAKRKRTNPGASDRLFNDSGTLAAGIAAIASGVDWLITVPPNRLDPATTFATRMMARLRELVPALNDPLSVPAVKAAIEASVRKMISVTR